jgi:Skp family chaperone for outer membrane proteins
MKSTSALLAALLAAAIPAVAHAQVAAAPGVPAAPAAASPVAPTAYPAKIALIAFEQAVLSTNEGQKTLAETQKKYAPQKTKIEGLSAEIDTLKKQLQAGQSLTDQQRAAKLKEIDAKDKELQRESEDAQNAYDLEVRESLSKVMQKVNIVLQDYVKKNGYTLLLDVGGQQSPVMWAATEPNADITQAVVDAYNASSGVAAPPPAAPAPAAGAARPRPSSSTTPKAPAGK